MGEVMAITGERAQLEGNPDYKLEILPSSKRVKVVFNGIVVADTTSARLLRETRYPPVYYLPREDVRMDLMQRTAHHTHCPFKGNANYWSLSVGDKTAENVVWSYEDPLPEMAELSGYIAFYQNRMDAWYEEDAEVSIDPDNVVYTRGNPFTGWLMSEAWEAATTPELVARLGRKLVEEQVPLMRLALIVRTLHPQLLGNAYRWHRGSETSNQTEVPYEALTSSAYLNSPLVPIFDGVGGIRRRLEGDNPVLDFPILRDLQADGATDYVAMPLPFSNGQTNALTLTTDEPGGFSTKDLGHIYEILPLLSRLFEVHALHQMSRSLLDTYLGAYTGDRVLNGRVKRGDGEDINAVIWFCDLRDSTQMAENLSRAEYLNVLNSFFECTASAVLERGGEVLKFIGDAVLAIFPIDDENPVPGCLNCTPISAACFRAIEAAKDSSRRLEALNAERTGRGEAALRFALSIHKGKVTYGNVGVDQRLDFTVIGPAANEAVRIGNICKHLDQQILFSAEIAQNLCSGAVSLGRHSLRGVRNDREIFTLENTEPAPVPEESST
ncbi:DUF427 domain-containing protein [Denitrobaculum tricleocarpae]|uniref:DUF427 domain-containing protein n=1 Tax=Denitrobaculum tricleocarpae TaxID=2591009 RepID=A0A545TXF7_9PROT|nr:DUF427 domain-containing protein [Denitrobaculum tricleocarpae]TQV81880.1 DUF427 domain-containing protein [Denitrobaculum tricleocarpae]